MLVWKTWQGLKENIEPNRISDYAIFIFENKLSEHFEQEEKELSSNDSLKEQAFVEHQHICQLVNNIQTDKQNTVLLKQFADKLESHIRFEERTLFDFLQNNFTENELTAIGENHSGKAIDVSDNWNDKFWNYINSSNEK